MRDFSKKLLGIYGSIVFFISLFVSYVLFKGAAILEKIGAINQASITIFYTIVGIMCVAYSLFLAVIIVSILKGKEEDLKFDSNKKYFNWRSR